MDENQGLLPIPDKSGLLSTPANISEHGASSGILPNPISLLHKDEDYERSYSESPFAIPQPSLYQQQVQHQQKSFSVFKDSRSSANQNKDDLSAETAKPMEEKNPEQQPQQKGTARRTLLTLPPGFGTTSTSVLQKETQGPAMSKKTILPTPASLIQSSQPPAKKTLLPQPLLALGAQTSSFSSGTTFNNAPIFSFPQMPSSQSSSTCSSVNMTSATPNFPPPSLPPTNIPPPDLLSGLPPTNFPPPPINVPPPGMSGLTVPLNMPPTNLPPPGLLSSSTSESNEPGVSTIAPAVTSMSTIDVTVPPPVIVPGTVVNAPPVDFSLPPPGMPPAFNTSMPPPNFSEPPPFALGLGGLTLPPMNQPPPGYADTSEKKDDYHSELQDWYKQLQDYEHQMLEYFEKCATKLREWHERGGDQTEEYRVEYEKLTKEYDKYMEYMKQLKTYYGQHITDSQQTNEPTAASTLAEITEATTVSTETEVVTSDPLVMPTVPASEAVTSTITEIIESVPMMTAITDNSLVDYSSPSNNPEAPEPTVTVPISTVQTMVAPFPVETVFDQSEVGPAMDPSQMDMSSLSGNTRYYADYYKQMINYFRDLLKTTAPEAAPSSESEDEQGKKMSKNQRKKQKRKQKEKGNKKQPAKPTPKANTQAAIAGPLASATQQPPPPPPPSSDQSSILFDPTRPPPGYQDPSSDPQAVMQEYFQRFGSTGEWDWASWNNYISAISRANPQWYSIFMQYSSAMGIDWEDMYNSWVTSSSTTTAALTTPPVPPPQITGEMKSIFGNEEETSQSAANASTSGTNAENAEQTKPGVDKVDSGDDDDDDTSDYCRTCEQSFTSDYAYTLHLRGVKHMHKALEQARLKNPENFKEEVIKQEEAVAKDSSKEDKHLEWVLNQYKSEKRKGLGLSGSFFCTLCHVECTSEKALSFHLNGQKHTRNLEQVMQTGPKSVEDRKVPKKKATVRIQSMLDTCLEALVGLNYVTEYQREDPLSSSRYFCELCDHRFEAQSFIQHVTGVKHRKNYLKYNYPDLYEVFDEDSSISSIKVKRLDVFTRKVEEFEGRKRLSIKMEITNPLLKEQKKKEADEKRLAREAREKRRAEIASAVRDKARAARKLVKKRAKVQKRREERRVAQDAQVRARYGLCEEELEEGEIESEEEEEVDTRKYRLGSDDEGECSDDDSVSSVSTSSLDSDDLDTVPGGEAGELLDEEDVVHEEEEEAFDELEMAEFEDVFSSDRPPLAVQLAEDRDRDEFIRRIKEKKMLKVRELSKAAMEEFLFEAEWALERRRSQDAERRQKEEAEREKKRKEQEEERKRKREEQAHVGFTSNVDQSGSATAPPPPMNVQAGPPPGMGPMDMNQFRAPFGASMGGGQATAMAAAMAHMMSKMGGSGMGVDMSAMFGQMQQFMGMQHAPPPPPLEEMQAMMQAPPPPPLEEMQARMQAPPPPPPAENTMMVQGNRRRQLLPTPDSLIEGPSLKHQRPQKTLLQKPSTSESGLLPTPAASQTQPIGGLLATPSSLMHGKGKTTMGGFGNSMKGKTLLSIPNINQGNRTQQSAVKSNVGTSLLSTPFGGGFRPGNSQEGAALLATPSLHGEQRKHFSLVSDEYDEDPVLATPSGLMDSTGSSGEMTNQEGGGGCKSLLQRPPVISQPLLPAPNQVREVKQTTSSLSLLPTPSQVMPRGQSEETAPVFKRPALPMPLNDFKRRKTEVGEDFDKPPMSGRQAPNVGLPSPQTLQDMYGEKPPARKGMSSLLPLPLDVARRENQDTRQPSNRGNGAEGKDRFSEIGSQKRPSRFEEKDDEYEPSDPTGSPERYESHSSHHRFSTRPSDQDDRDMQSRFKGTPSTASSGRFLPTSDYGHNAGPTKGKQKSLTGFVSRGQSSFPGNMAPSNMGEPFMRPPPQPVPPPSSLDDLPVDVDQLKAILNSVQEREHVPRPAHPFARPVGNPDQRDSSRKVGGGLLPLPSARQMPSQLDVGTRRLPSLMDLDTRRPHSMMDEGRTVMMSMDEGRRDMSSMDEDRRRPHPTDKERRRQPSPIHFDRRGMSSSMDNERRRPHASMNVDRRGMHPRDGDKRRHAVRGKSKQLDRRQGRGGARKY